MADSDRERALESALANIEKQFGKGAVMRLGDDTAQQVPAIPTGALTLDVALGVGGLPRGRVVELYGPESSGKTTLALHVLAEAQKQGGIAAFIDAEHALDPTYAGAIGLDIDELLVAQPDTGEQALEIMDMLIRSGAVDVIAVDSVAALTPRAEIEGEMGDSHVGLQARLMSQAMRKLAGSLKKSSTCAIFINQIREKIGVMFGCMSYATRVTLADGAQEKIGKIVNQRLPVKVLSYDFERGEFVPRRVVDWFDNGRTDEFLKFVVARGGGNGRSQFAATRNHLISTLHGWVPAGDLEVGDTVLQAVPHHLSEFQWEVILGGLMGDGALSPTRSGHGARFRMGHGARQQEYADWKASLFGNVNVSRWTNDKGAVFHDLQPLPELAELRDNVYQEGRKVLDQDYLKRLTPLSIAIWYQDDGGFQIRSKGLQTRSGEVTGRVEICVEALEATSRRRLRDHLADTWGIEAGLRDRNGKAVLIFPPEATSRLHRLIAPYVHPSMEYKLLPQCQGRFDVEPVLGEEELQAVPMPIREITPRPPNGRQTHRFDIEVEGNHNYLVDGILVHNSPETTPGGRALKFYSSVRLDIRRIETLKDGKDAVGNRCRVKVVKNKCLAAGTRVFDPTTGLTHAIEDVVEEGVGTSVWATDKRGRLEIRPIGVRLDQGEQEVIGLRLRDGTELTVTPDHRILTEEGWREAGELGVGDRVARPRRAGSFGDQQPVPPAHARMLGSLLGDGPLAPERRIPAGLFAPEVSREVLANLLSGLWETAGWISREQTGGVRLGLAITSEQLAWQLHWLLLRFGIVSTVRAREPGSRRSLVEDRRIQGARPCWQVRVSGIDDVHRFAAEVPTWGPKGQRLVETLDEPASAEQRRSRAVHLPASVTEPVRSYLADRGVSARDAAGMIGEPAGDPRGGMAQVLGATRIRRDRLAVLADALESRFLRDVLAEEVYYERIQEVTTPRTERTYDLEVPELHNLVADGVVVHNCAPPFRLAEFDIVYGEGISKEGTLLDLGVEEGLIRKAGAWYSYDDEQLGQGRENARQFLREHDDVAREIEKRIKEELGIAPLAGDADEADEDEGEE